MIKFTMCEFSGMVIPSCCSLILRWWRHPADNFRSQAGHVMHQSLNLHCSVLPVPITDQDSQRRRCRLVYGYDTNESDQPSHLFWPRRSSKGHFRSVDPVTGRYFDPEAAELDIPLDDIQSNLVVEQSSARRFHLTPICVPDDHLQSESQTRFTKTRVCTSCFGSTNFGMRLFTKSQICTSCFGSTNSGHLKF